MPSSDGGDDEDSQSYTNQSTIDEVLAEVGFHRYQWNISIWASLVTMLIGAHVLTNFYTTLEGEVECTLPGCVDEEVPSVSDFCANTTAFRAAGWVKRWRGQTVVTEWGDCVPTWHGPTTASVFFLGWFIGGFAAGRAADRIGRLRPAFFLGFLAALVCAAAASSSGFVVYLAWKLCHGACIGGWSLCTYVFCVESIPDASRSLVATCVLAAFGVGTVAIVPIAQAVPDWRPFLLIIGGASLPPLLWVCSLEESPRWLLSKKKIDRVRVVVKRICEINDRPVPVILATLRVPSDVVECDDNYVGMEAGRPGAQGNSSPVKPGLRAALRHPGVRWRIVAMGFSWFAASVVYYGLNFAAGDLGGDVYVNGLIIAVGELPAYWFQYLLIDRPSMGRKKTTAGGFAIGAATCVLYVACEKVGLTTVGKGLAVLGKTAVAACFAIVYIWGGELFPTDIRSSALGVCTASARVGGLVAPFVAKLGTAGFFFFSAAAAVAACLDVTLPETLNAPSFDTLAELIDHEAGGAGTQSPMAHRRPSDDGSPTFPNPITLSSQDNGRDEDLLADPDAVELDVEQS
ncbi:Organic cation transporter protein [Diplonema papillatum]|nr:Organic cation transporter protein [Diplonema papillatum]